TRSAGPSDSGGGSGPAGLPPPWYSQNSGQKRSKRRKRISPVGSVAVRVTFNSSLRCSSRYSVSGKRAIRLRASSLLSQATNRSCASCWLGHPPQPFARLGALLSHVTEDTLPPAR